MAMTLHASDFRASDVSQSTSQMWDASALRRVVPFIQGQNVVVEVKRSTGSSVVGEIVRMQDSTMYSYYPHLAVKDQNGITTLFPVDHIGTIVILESMSAGKPGKWDALDAIRNERHTAIAMVKELIGVDFPDETPRKGPRRWVTTLMPDGGVRVSWGTSLFDHTWWVRDGVVTSR